MPGLPDAWPGWEDSAVPPEKVAEYLPKLRDLFSKYDYHPSLYGHFGQGCIHCRVGFDLYTAEGTKKFRAFLDEAADLVVSLGGSLSGEHGDGQARGELLPKMYGPELMEAFREFKRIWDPDGKMNPGKLIDAYAVTSNLRVGPDYNPPQPKTHFKYPKDHFTFARAALRCVGVGKCRAKAGRDVSQLPGHAGRKAFHAWPRPALVGNAQRRTDQGRLAVETGQGGPRPVPVLQGVQE